MNVKVEILRNRTGNGRMVYKVGDIVEMPPLKALFAQEKGWARIIDDSLPQAPITVKVAPVAGRKGGSATGGQVRKKTK